MLIRGKCSKKSAFIQHSGQIFLFCILRNLGIWDDSPKGKSRWWDVPILLKTIEKLYLKRLK